MKLIVKRGAAISSPLPHPSPATPGVVRLAQTATLLASPARVEFHPVRIILMGPSQFHVAPH
jgi:hypothetical protein